MVGSWFLGCVWRDVWPAGPQIKIRNSFLPSPPPLLVGNTNNMQPWQAFNHVIIKLGQTGELAGEVAVKVAGEVAGKMAGEVAGEMAVKVAGEVAGEVVGEVAGEGGWWGGW